MRTQEDVRNYWKKVEEELGEPILGYALGQLKVPLDEIPSLAWCLFYITNTRVFIRYMPSERRVLSLPMGGSPGKPATVTLQRERIQKIDICSGKRGWWQRVFSPVIQVRFQYCLYSEGEQEICFTMESEKNQFLRQLQQE